MNWNDSNTFWAEKGLRLPTRLEAMVVYEHKSEFAAALIAAGYQDIYFQTDDHYFTAEVCTYVIVDGSYAYYYLDMGNGNRDDHASRNSILSSFGVYVK